MEAQDTSLFQQITIDGLSSDPRTWQVALVELALLRGKLVDDGQAMLHVHFHDDSTQH